MPFRVDDPSVTIDTSTPKETTPMTYSKQDEQDRVQARIDHDTAMQAQRPKTSKDARLDAIERAKRGDGVGDGSKDARAKMIDRMKGAAQ